MNKQANQFIEHIIIPALDWIGLNSPQAVELLIGTAIQESNLKYVVQIRGPACGFWQMEPATHNDIWGNYLKGKSRLRGLVKELAGARYNGDMVYHDELAGNCYYAAAMARIHYRRVKEALPGLGDLEKQAYYYKRYYNTKYGKATEQQYIDNYKRFL